MNIALLYDSLGRSKGGVEAWLYHVAEALKTMGHRPHAVAAEMKMQPHDGMPADVPITWLRRPQSGILARLADPSYRKHCRALAHQIARNVPNAEGFWTRSFWMALAAKEIAQGRPVVFVQATPFAHYLRLVRTTAPTRLSIAKKIGALYKEMAYRRLEYTAMQHADCLVYLSQSRMNQTLACYGNSFRRKSYLVPGGVNTERFSPRHPKRRWDGTLQVISVSRLSVEKNLGCLLSALRIARDHGRKVRATIVGQGPMMSTWTRLAVELGISEWVDFAGEQTAVERYLRDSDLFVLPSTYEGFGMAYVEALACGLPCIAIRSNPPAIEVAADEIIEHNQCGWLLRENSSQELAEVLCRVCDNPSVLESWSLRARKLCMERFTWESVAQRLLALTTTRDSRI